MKLWRKRIRQLAVFFAAAAALALVWVNRGLLLQPPWAARLQFASPSYGSAVAGGGLVVIDNSKRRVALLDGQYEVATLINGGNTGGDGFFYAESAVSDGENIYVAEVRYQGTGTRLSGERLLQFSRQGRFERCLFERTYGGENPPRQLGNIVSLRVDGQRLTFLYKEPAAISLYEAADGEVRLVRTADTGAVPFVHHAFYNASLDTLLVTTKDGRLFAEEDGAFRPAADWSDSTGETVPWEFAADSAGGLYAADPGRLQIVRFEDGGALLPDADAGLFYRLSCQEDRLCFTDGERVLLTDTKGQPLFSDTGAPFTSGMRLLGLAAWACAGLLSLTGLWLSVRLLRRIAVRQHSKIFRAAALAGSAVVVTTVLVSVNILTQMTARIDNQVLSGLRQTAQTLSQTSGQTFGDAVGDIVRLGDYGGEAYRRMRSYLDVSCEAAYEKGGNQYYIVFKHDGDLLYGVSDYEDTVGTIYPYAPYAGSGYDEVFENGEIAVVAGEADSYGYWAFAIAPIYNAAGETVGILEVGSNLFGEQLQTRALVKNVAVSTAVLILGLLLLLSEGAQLAECLSAWRRAPADGRREILEIVRPLAFLLFCATSFSAAFIPQLSERLYALSGWNALPSTLGAAFPMSVQMLFIALSAAAGGVMVDKAGARRVMLSGLAVACTGYLIIAFGALYQHYALFLGGHIFSGCGAGAAVVSLNAMPAMASGEARRNTLFSGLNVGLLSGVVLGAAAGAYIAGAGGYALTFVSAAAVLLCAFLLARMCMPKQSAARGREEEPAGGVWGTGLPHFLTRRSVWSFLLFLMLPFLVMLCFKDYLFPLFASAEGYSDVSIGNVLLFAGALSIYLTPPLSRAVLRRLRPKGAAVASSALFVAALALFGLVRTMPAAVAAVFLISLSGGLGLTNQGSYYASLPDVGRFGTGKGMGVYSFFDNLGQTAGPILFGMLLMAGDGDAVLLIAAGACALLLLFILLHLREKGEGK